MKDYFKSSGLFMWATLKYWVSWISIILALFQIVNVLYVEIVDIEQWIVWTIIGVLFLFALVRNYHVLRMQYVALQPSPWIDKYLRENKELPVLPDYLRPFVINYEAGKPISKSIDVRTPSEQSWNNLSPSHQDEFLQLADWIGKKREDIIWDMQRNAPKHPPDIDSPKWKPHKQR